MADFTLFSEVQCMNVSVLDIFGFEHFEKNSFEQVTQSLPPSLLTSPLTPHPSPLTPHPSPLTPPSHPSPQMCINIANEQLQHFFNERVFQWEVQECEGEGVRVEEVSYTSNWPVVNLFLEVSREG